MSVQGEENVVQLQIPIYDSILVKVLQSEAYLCGVESGKPVSSNSREGTTTILHLLGSLSAKLAALDVQHEIASADVLHHKVHSRLCLEAGM